MRSNFATGVSAVVVSIVMVGACLAGGAVQSGLKVGDSVSPFDVDDVCFSTAGLAGECGLEPAFIDTETPDGHVVPVRSLIARVFRESPADLFATTSRKARSR